MLEMEQTKPTKRLKPRNQCRNIRFCACGDCGVVFRAGISGRKPTKCADCNPRRKRESCPVYYGNCKHCGKTWATSQQGRATPYCSRECKWSHQVKPILLECRGCGKAYETSIKEYQRVKACSKECYERYLSTKGPALEAQKLLTALRKKANRKPRNVKFLVRNKTWETTKKLLSGVCRKCNQESRTGMKQRGAFCQACHKESTRRHKRNAKQMRRAKKHGSDAERFCIKDVYVRDGWRCYLCGDEVRQYRSLVGIVPNEATIDHVWPISKGGTHTWGNVQTCCRECNQRKGDMLLSEYVAHRLHPPTGGCPPIPVFAATAETQPSLFFWQQRGF